MSRLLALALLIGSVGCGNGSKSSADQRQSTGGDERIPVPGAVKGAPDPQPAAKGPQKLPDATDPRLHLKADEGTLTVAKMEATAGSEATATVALEPVGNYHISTEYPTELWLEAPAGVTLPKTLMTAGGRSKQGDAATFGERAIAFAIKATAETAGSYEIKGVFKFGICEHDSCHSKTQPIVITVAAS